MAELNELVDKCYEAYSHRYDYDTIDIDKIYIQYHVMDGKFPTNIINPLHPSGTDTSTEVFKLSKNTLPSNMDILMWDNDYINESDNLIFMVADGCHWYFSLNDSHYACKITTIPNKNRGIGARLISEFEDHLLD